MRLRALIFDCDGTLTDTMGLHYSSWRRSLAGHGIALSEEEFFANSGTPSSRVIPAVANRAGVPLEFQEALEEKERYFLEDLPNLKMFDSVVAVAEKYRGQLPLAVASGGTRRLVESQLKQVNILHWFDTVVTCEDTEKHKPDPDVFLEAARRLGVNAEDCCVFEDGDPGIKAADRAEMLCIDVRPYREQREIVTATREMLALMDAG